MTNTATTKTIYRNGRNQIHLTSTEGGEELDLLIIGDAPDGAIAVATIAGDKFTYAGETWTLVAPGGEA
jgi:hypothetical protein